MPAAQIGAVFLARVADGVGPLGRFARSYERWEAGVDHELIVIFKGDEQSPELQQAKAVFSRIRHTAISVPDHGFDLGAYRAVAERIEHRYLCFLNTHSEILVSQWLLPLLRAAADSRVGVAASMGSFESIRSTVLLLRRAIWAAVGSGRQVDPALGHYFDFVMRLHRPAWYAADGGLLKPAAGSRGLRDLRRWAARLLFYPSFRRQGTALIWPGAAPFEYLQFPPFPNPHIRTNGFVMSRERFLKLQIPQLPSKVDTSLIESGPDSLTRRLLDDGLKAVVVDRAGAAHDIDRWPQSQTFRLGDQNGLLFADNHTRAFASMSAGAKATHERITWGDFLKPAPADFPSFGIDFGRKELLKNRA